MIEFDNTSEEMIKPCQFVKRNKNMPETVVTFFEKQILDYLLENFKTEVIAAVNTAYSEHKIYKINYKGKDIAVVQSGIGEPYSVSMFEEIIALGAKNILMFGSCGTLVHLDAASIIIPESAVRDEGTSYHYMPPSDEISLNEKYVNKIAKVCDELNLNYCIGKTWTIDALYRETKAKIAKKIEEGCICVEMECAGMAAMAKFRNVEFAEFFYAADTLAKSRWEPRILKDRKLNGQEKSLILALECASRFWK